MRSIGLMTFMMPLGLSVACGIYFGNSLGEGKPKLAMQYYRVCLFLALVVTFLQIMALYFGIDQVIAVFTEQESIAKIMKVAWPMLRVKISSLGHPQIPWVHEAR